MEYRLLIAPVLILTVLFLYGVLLGWLDKKYGPSNGKYDITWLDEYKPKDPPMWSWTTTITQPSKFETRRQKNERKRISRGSKIY